MLAAPGTKALRGVVETYLRAGDNIRDIQSALSKDRLLARGMERLRGLRIVKMDEWECLVSYVLATYANIPRITRMIDAISCRYGDEIACGVHAFPSRPQLSEARENDLRRLGLGYRASYVKELCETVDEGELDRMKSLSYDDLRSELLGLPGVGNKVADCVSLFGFGRLEAFPVDVWIKKALLRLYSREGTYRALREFAQERFGRYAGYAQEYLFYNERAGSKEGTCAFRGRG